LFSHPGETAFLPVFGRGTERRTIMAAYLIQFSFTPKGVENIRESPARVEAAKRTVRELGGAVRAFYAILGSEFDTFFIIDAPNELKAGEMALAIAAHGQVRTRTQRLFTEEEYRTLCSSLP
jgi:uncharacterized protein with GYD domain